MNHKRAVHRAERQCTTTQPVFGHGLSTWARQDASKIGNQKGCDSKNDNKPHKHSRKFLLFPFCPTWDTIQYLSNSCTTGHLHQRLSRILFLLKLKGKRHAKKKQKTRRSTIDNPSAVAAVALPANREKSHFYGSPPVESGQKEFPTGSPCGKSVSSWRHAYFQSRNILRLSKTAPFE